ncbi:MAG: phenylalanine--tRNA ligase subunit alpha [Phycisphaerales bacterium]|jgi:phenylalanyl-tRNA synthetase alpha chain|nr:phenylalanine--tRNA ligase subunit alpha [Phycisphaerales bacterium]MDP6692860.1 phenylalanine--tRNA ligase subunit alpha [Phycisphaerales bacterium]
MVIMLTMLATLDKLQKEAMGDIEAVDSIDALESWRIVYLGSKGRLKGVMPLMKDVSSEEKPAVGKRLNEVKQALEGAFESRKKGLSGTKASRPPLDITETGEPNSLGRRHVITRTIDEITLVLSRMGFSVAYGPEVEDEFHNFNALNIPDDHPARDPIDNFFVDGGRMLRSQTSTVQIRVMEAVEPPIKIIAIGRVYRPDTHDATHFSMFHQCEGLFVAPKVSMVDLKSTLFQFVKAYFGEEAEVRFRPSFFPFTEPSAEVDMKMKIKGKWEWIEIGGCGLVDPNVFDQVGYDNEKWQGFAFGLGIERIAMLKYGIQDIRLLFENDSRFLRQF